MKKTTKILLVLAAVVAMTIGAVSTVMAADYPTIATWEGNEKEGWTAKNADGKAITNSWAVAESGIWYYFDSTGEMVVNDFIAGDDGWYYVGKDGAMATGWVKFTDDEGDDVIKDALTNRKAKEILSGNDNVRYGKEVWAYFDYKTGIAAEDEWIKDCQMDYYFDEVVMVAADYSYYIDDDEKTYGFAPDGHMYVDWTPVYYNFLDVYNSPIDSTKNAAIGWIYYNTDGSMMDEGWEKLDAWYYFADALDHEDNRFELAGLTDKEDEMFVVCLTDTYMPKLAKIDGENAFYFGADGRMVLGEATFRYASVDEEQFFTAEKAGDKKFGNAKFDLKSNKTFAFDKVTGAQKFGLVDGSLFCLADKWESVSYINMDGSDRKDHVYIDDDTVIDFCDPAAGNATIPGEMLKDVIAYWNKSSSDRYYCYFDKNGERVSDDTVSFYGLTIAIKGGKIVQSNGVTERIDGSRYHISDANGILKYNGKAIAYGVDNSSTDDYDVTVVVTGVEANIEESVEAIKDALEGEYVIGQKVEYKLATKYEAKFDSAIVKVLDADDKVVYASGDLFGSSINYKVSFNFPNLSNIEFKEGMKIVVELNTAEVNEVKYNGTVIGVYATGETVTIKAASGKGFQALPTGPDGIAYVKSSDNKVTYVDQVKFTMPAANVVVTGTETAAYAVNTKDCTNIKALEKNLYFAGDTVTLEAVTGYASVAVSKVVYDDANGNDTYVTDSLSSTGTKTSFVMPASNVKVLAKGAMSLEKKDINVVTSGAVTVGAIKVAGKAAAISGGAIETVEEGSTVTIAYTADVATGKKLVVTVKDETGLGVKDYTDKDGVITITMPAKDITVSIEVVTE